jgi:hypothetical protein
MKHALVTLTAAVAALASPCLATAAAPDPCKVVDSADAAKALGAPVTSETTRAIGNSLSCTYHTSALPRLSVTTVPFSSAAEAKTEFHAMVTSPLTYAPPSVDLQGIGDEAHRLGQMVYVRKGATVYTFAVIGPDKDGSVGLKTVALAKASIAHLH